jgi:sugar (glycoside-pentoside-hexuronide) transporter
LKASVAASVAPAEDARLNWRRKTVYASGDFTVNTVLASLNIVYVTFFLTQVAGLRPELAGMVQLVGRVVDAFSDPAMGRISDHCHWRAGRRRPFFLLGALPFGLSYALLWATPPGGQAAMFAYYTTWYVLLSLSMTVLSVPYLALQPEMAQGYDARTSLNTFRNMGSVIGILAAVSFRPVAGAFGGGPEGYAAAGVAYGLVMALPWLAVYGATWERPDFQARSTQISFVEGVRILVRHRTFRRLTGLYLCGRIAMDIVGAMLIIFFTHVIGRTGDFEFTMGLFIGTVVLVLPIWLRIARHFEKATLFVVGSLWWTTSFFLILAAQPDWPRWLLICFAPFGAVGYAVVDLMPWSMLGEVVDEDDLATGERREGLYNGFFMFLRKLAGTVAVALALMALGALGFVKGEQQSEQAILAIRLFTSLVPALLVGVGIAFALRYPLTRAAHARIRLALDARDAAS